MSSEQAESPVQDQPSSSSHQQRQHKKEKQPRQAALPATDNARSKAIKNEDAWKRMNFLYQSSYQLALAAPTSTLSRFYLSHMRKIASKLVMRITPGVKNTVCKRCGSLLIPGHSVDIHVLEEGSRGGMGDDHDRDGHSADGLELASASKLAELAVVTPSDQAGAMNVDSIVADTKQRAASSASTADSVSTAPSPSLFAPGVASNDHVPSASTSASSATSALKKRRCHRGKRAGRHHHRHHSARTTTHDDAIRASTPNSASIITHPSSAQVITTSAASTSSASASPTDKLQLHSSSHRRMRIHIKPVHVVSICRVCSTRKRMHTKTDEVDAAEKGLTVE